MKWAREGCVLAIEEGGSTSMGVLQAASAGVDVLLMVSLVGAGGVGSYQAASSWRACGLGGGGSGEGKGKERKMRIGGFGRNEGFKTSLPTIFYSL